MKSLFIILLAVVIGLGIFCAYAIKNQQTKVSNMEKTINDFVKYYKKPLYADSKSLFSQPDTDMGEYINQKESISDVASEERESISEKCTDGECNLYNLKEIEEIEFPQNETLPKKFVE